MRRFFPIAFPLYLILIALLSACGGQSAHKYTYVTLDGYEFTGTYTGGWENGQPNGEGEFSGEGERGRMSLAGSWSNGKPNGQCRQIVETDTYTRTYNGEYFYGVWQGNGTVKFEDLDGNLTRTYTGEFQDGQYNGSGEMTNYYTEEESEGSGCERRVYKGQFANSTWNGAGELTFYFTEEYATFNNVERMVYAGQYSDGWTGEIEVTFYLTSKYADTCKYDTEVNVGQYKDGSLVEPYRYIRYKDGKTIEEGRVRDGKYISDADKALDDSLYDGIRSLLGDGTAGDLFDIFAPAFYDRNAE